MGTLDVDRLIAYMRECDTVMTEPEMATVARKLQPHLGKPDPTTVLQEAEKLIRGDRQKEYGHPSINFKRIADSWSAYLGKELSPFDVCMLMILLKAQRCAEGPHKDTLVDIGGYTALAAVLAGMDDL